MTATINASTSSGVIVTSDTSGNLDFQSSGTSRLSVTSTGVSFTNASTAAPTFSAYMNGSQTVSAGATTKLIFNAELFDTNNNFDSTTNYRFTPTVAGYYQINYAGSNSQGSNLNARYNLYLYKNGSAYLTLIGYNGTSGDFQIANINTIVSMNGTTDYLEIYANPIGQSLQFYGATSTNATFSGAYIRSL